MKENKNKSNVFDEPSYIEKKQDEHKTNNDTNSVSLFYAKTDRIKVILKFVIDLIKEMK